MLLCADMSEPKVELEAESEMPCHGSADVDQIQSADSEHECECQGCVQFSSLVEQAVDVRGSSPSLKLFDHDNFISSDLNAIYHPPKYIS